VKTKQQTIKEKQKEGIGVKLGRDGHTHFKVRLMMVSSTKREKVK